MSGTIGSVGGGGYNVVQQLITDSASVRAQINVLTYQASSGLVSKQYAGLGDGAATALSINPQLDNLKTWHANIRQATGVMTVTQAAMKQVARCVDFGSY